MYIYNFLMNKYINFYLYKTSEIQRKGTYFLFNFTTMQEMRGNKPLLLYIMFTFFFFHFEISSLFNFFFNQT